MKKNILVFSNGEKIGDAIIKLPLINEIKRRMPEYHLTWVTNIGNTAYNNELKNISYQYIDEIIEKVDLNPFFGKKYLLNMILETFTMTTYLIHKKLY